MIPLLSNYGRSAGPSVKVWPSLGPLSKYGPPRAARQILRAARAPTISVDHAVVGDDVAAVGSASHKNALPCKRMGWLLSLHECASVDVYPDGDQLVLHS